MFVLRCFWGLPEWLAGIYYAECPVRSAVRAAGYQFSCLHGSSQHQHRGDQPGNHGQGTFPGLCWRSGGRRGRVTLRHAGTRPPIHRTRAITSPMPATIERGPAKRNRWSNAVPFVPGSSRTTGQLITSTPANALSNPRGLQIGAGATCSDEAAEQANNGDRL
jgi:hypothetical protein